MSQASLFAFYRHLVYWRQFCQCLHAPAMFLISDWLCDNLYILQYIPNPHPLHTRIYTHCVGRIRHRKRLSRKITRCQRGVPTCCLFSSDVLAQYYFCEKFCCNFHLSYIFKLGVILTEYVMNRTEIV